MSDKLMDTEPGGERQNQYEGIHTFIEPHSKQGGQLEGNSDRTSVDKPTRDPGAPNTQGVTTADKIRYGQSIQEGGAGGKTTTSTGQANTGSGFGGAEKLEGLEDESAVKSRNEQGYGGERDMRRDVGA